MPLKSDTLERQLEVAKQQRTTVEGKFQDKELKKQPLWRNANAKVTALEARLEQANARSSRPGGDDADSGNDE